MQTRFQLLADLIVKHFYKDKCQMVILYGSYARGDFKDYFVDDCDHPGVIRSDYDIMVLHTCQNAAGVPSKLEGIENRYFRLTKDDRHIQLWDQHIDNFNREIGEGRYFPLTIKKEGIILYDSGIYKLARRPKLNYKQVLALAEEYFADSRARADSFFSDVPHAFARADYSQSLFYLHQTCEHLFHAITLVHILDKKKSHDLVKLNRAVRGFAPEELWNVLPHDTDEEKRLVKKLYDGYIKARYQAKYPVTKEDIEALIPWVEHLREMTATVCERRIAFYKQQAAGE